MVGRKKKKKKMHDCTIMKFNTEFSPIQCLYLGDGTECMLSNHADDTKQEGVDNTPEDNAAKQRNLNGMEK